LNSLLANTYFPNFNFSDRSFPDSLRKTYFLELNEIVGSEIAVELNSTTESSILLVFCKTHWMKWKFTGTILPNNETVSKKIEINRKMKFFSRIENFSCNCCVVNQTVFWHLKTDSLKEYITLPYSLESLCNRTSQKDSSKLSYKCAYIFFHQDSIQIQYSFHSRNIKGEDSLFTEKYALKIDAIQNYHVYQKQNTSWITIEELPLWNF
jgi:hypothetical protein